MSNDATTAGIEAYRAELEDENAHPDDALRIGMLVAIDRADSEWRNRARELAEALLSLAETAGMPDSYRATDSRTTLAQNTLDDLRVTT